MSEKRINKSKKEETSVTVSHVTIDKVIFKNMSEK